MNKLSPFTLLLLMLAFNFSCDSEQKDDLFLDNIYSDEPIFNFFANEGEYVIEAGKNGFYMFADYEVDDMDVYSFVARFAKLSTCLEKCDEELIIKIRDFQPSGSSGPIEIAASITTGDYFFSDNQDIDFRDVLIEYTNEDGKTFRTDLAEQNVENTFKILAVSDFNVNENGNPTKKVDVTFSCILGDVDNELEISFINAEAVISVAYPN